MRNPIFPTITAYIVGILVGGHYLPWWGAILTMGAIGWWQGSISAERS